MRTVCDKCRDNLDGPEDQVLGKSSPIRQPHQEKQDDAYYFCHVPQNIASRRLGVEWLCIAMPQRDRSCVVQ